MILDEPTNHLDIKYQLQIMDIVKNLGLTVAAAIHDLNIAALYCDRLIAIKDGMIAGLGTPAELLTEDFIYRIYEVRAKVESSRDGFVCIRYLPQHHIN
jgi:iron compound ABC transporter, ATP-binding protein